MTTDRRTRARAAEHAWLLVARPLAVAAGALAALTGLANDVPIPFAVLRGALAFAGLSMFAALVGRAVRALGVSRGAAAVPVDAEQGRGAR